MGELIAGLAKFVSAIAWPTVMLVAFWIFRIEVKQLLSVLAVKIDRASRLKIGRTGIELAEEIARTSVSHPISVVANTKEENMQNFEKYANEYDHLSISDLKQRVDARSKLADELGLLAVELKISRAGLAESKSEAKLVAFATMAVQRPAANDLALLEKAASTANFRFTRYRVVLALLPSLSGIATSAKTLQRIDKILDAVEHRPASPPDESLQRLIDRTRELVVGLYGSLAQ